MNESVFQFGRARSLVGILSHPSGEPTTRPAIILLCAGLTHRVGPSRLYVKIARRLAKEGHVVLRFDLSGIGDSLPRADHLPYEQSALAETVEAMDCLQAEHLASRFILMGHCSGAVNSFRAARRDPRVVGALMINLEGGNEDWTQYDRERKEARYYTSYYRQGLFDAQRWRRLLTGRVAVAKVMSNVFRGMLWNKLQSWRFRQNASPGRTEPGTLPAEVRQARSDLEALANRGTQIMFVHSEGSTGLEFVRATLGETLQSLLAAGRVCLAVVPQSDHLFTLLRSQRQLLDLLSQWAASWA